MIINKDCIEGMKEMEESSVDCIITSPPYNKKGLLGKVKQGNQIWGKFQIDYNTYGDDMPEDQYQAWMIEFLNQCHRVIKPEGSIFFNHKPRRYKNRCYLPTDFISHIYWFCKKKPKVFRDAIDPAYKSEVWVINPDRQKQHPAPFPPQLVENCIKLTTQEGDLVLDPFMGSGTTAVVSQELNRKWVGFDIDSNYVDMTRDRVTDKEPSQNPLKTVLDAL
jgi:site-specific DNA-methyltransferase (adenine-specific)